MNFPTRGCCRFTCWCEHVNVIVFALIMDNYSMPWGESLSRSLQACSSVTACWIGLFTDTMMKHLQSMDAARSFSEFRQEASMLHSLQHRVSWLWWASASTRSASPWSWRRWAASTPSWRSEPKVCICRKQCQTYKQLWSGNNISGFVIYKYTFYLKVKQCIFNIWDFKKNI